MNARCTGPLNKPDSEGGRRTRELTDLLVDELELGILWDEYGLVGDIVVIIFFSVSPSANITSLAIYKWFS